MFICAHLPILDYLLQSFIVDIQSHIHSISLFLCLDLLTERGL